MKGLAHQDAQAFDLTQINRAIEDASSTVQDTMEDLRKAKADGIELALQLAEPAAVTATGEATVVARSNYEAPALGPGTRPSASSPGPRAPGLGL